MRLPQLYIEQRENTLILADQTDYHFTVILPVASRPLSLSLSLLNIIRKYSLGRFQTFLFVVNVYRSREKMNNRVGVEVDLIGVKLNGKLKRQKKGQIQKRKNELRAREIYYGFDYIDTWLMHRLSRSSSVLQGILVNFCLSCLFPIGNLFT